MVTADTVDDISQKIAQQHARALAAVRADATRTEGWKRHQIAKVYLTMRDERDREVEAARRRKASDRQRLEEKVFGLAGLPGDQASLAISRRDAGDRASRLQNPRQALELLARATRSGDEPLARAIAERAYEADWADVANTFADTRPSLQKPFEELWIAQPPARGHAARLKEQMAGRRIEQPELQGLTQWQIEKLAASEPETVAEQPAQP